MANEAVLVFETSIPIPFVCATGTGIEKGSLLKLTDPMTAIINSGSGDKLAGIAAVEHIANDGTSISVYQEGIFRMVTGAAVAVGAAVMSSATANKVITSTGVSGSSILGYALEASGGDGETILVRVNVGGGGAIA
jgi:predicted RecA/RadA family phage recombinase